jgi:3-isopropylmalate/(R)-2-methylmalate dehydratase small subunit
MERFTILSGRAAPLMRANIDTDAIISAQAMIGGQLSDPGAKLFTRWRFEENGRERPDFVLNAPRYRGASVLVAGPNFGCGSSREHAVWALVGYGIRCVVAASFGEIFYDNSFQNGLLPAIVSAADAERIAGLLEQANDPAVTVDLNECKIRFPNGVAFDFTVPKERREALLNGLDDLSFLLGRKDQVDAWVRADRARRPWAHAARQPA